MARYIQESLGSCPQGTLPPWQQVELMLPFFPRNGLAPAASGGKAPKSCFAFSKAQGAAVPLHPPAAGDAELINLLSTPCPTAAVAVPARGVKESAVPGDGHRRARCTMPSLREECLSPDP